MKPVKTTAEILAFKALNRDIDKAWVDWAVDMLIAGYDSEHLTILAGESEPFNQFQIQELADKVLAELQLDYSNKDQTIKNYANRVWKDYEFCTKFTFFFRKNFYL